MFLAKKLLSNQKAIHFDQMMELHNHVTKSIVMAIVAASFIAFLLDYYYSPYTLQWLVFVYALSLVRFLHLKRLPANKITYKKMRQQTRGYFIFSIIEAAHWLIPFLLLLQQNLLSLYGLFFLTIMIAMVTMAILIYPTNLAIYATYSAIIISPITFYFFANERFIVEQVISVMVWIYIAILFFFHYRNTKKAQHALELKHENIALIKSLEQQTQESLRQQQIAEKANQEKSHFIAAASHDIRQPLHAVNLFTELLRNKTTDQEQQQDISNIQKGLDSLEELLHALLDISRLDSGVVVAQKTHFPIQILLNKLQEQLQIQAQQKELALLIDEDNSTVFCDPILLERVLGNLLSNAIKYTEKGHVKLSCSHIKNNRLNIRVEDTGIGIAKTHFNDIFNDFFQINNQERDRQKGLGLGLSIVKKITHLLDIPLTFHSTVNHGSTFELSVPLGEKAVQSQITETLPTTQKFEKITVLIIDNSIDILRATQDLLESWGCTVLLADSGEKALKLIKNGAKPDVILTDYWLDNALNGCQVVQKIYAIIDKTLLDKVPTIVITGNTDQNTLNEIKKEGLPLLHKPLKPAQLRLTITRLLE